MESITTYGSRATSESPSQSSPASWAHFNPNNLKVSPASPISPISPFSSTSTSSPITPLTTSTGPSPPGHPFYRTARHVRVEQTSQSIKGTFRISPLAPDDGLKPPLYDLPNPDPKCASSAEFVTRSSAVNVEILIGMGQNREEEDLHPSERGHRKSWNGNRSNSHMVLGGKHSKNGSNSSVGSEKEVLKRVWVNAKSHHGAVKVKIPQYLLPNPLSLRLKSHNGAITLVIPQSFSGVISFKSDSGVLKLSPRIQARWKALGNEIHKHRGVGRIGAVSKDGHTMTEEEEKREKDGKRGDSAELITKMGSVYLEESGEEKEGGGCFIV